MSVVQMVHGVEFTGPMDVDVGPDGQIYVLGFGKGWQGTDGARLSRLVYKPSQRRGRRAVAATGARPSPSRSS